VSAAAAVALIAVQSAEQAVTRAALAERTQAVDDLTGALDRQRLMTYLLRVGAIDRELTAGNVRRADPALSAGDADLRGWERHFLRRQCRPDFTDLAGPALDPLGSPPAIAFGPGGRLLAVVSGDPYRNSGIRVWDVRKRESVLTITGARGDV